MASANWLTQEDLLAELEGAGITLPERTLRFWVTNGVLAAPVRKPFPEADGRVGYFPRDTLALIPKILKLQEDGWKLRQIRKQLEAPTPERPQRALQTSGHEAEEWAARYLQDLLTDSEARDRRRCFSSPGAASTELRQVRHYLVARLERLVGRGTAVRATSTFLLSLSQRDTKRLLTRLKVMSSGLRGRDSDNSTDRSDRERLARGLAGDKSVKLGHELDSVIRELANIPFADSTTLGQRTLLTLRQIEGLLAGQEAQQAADTLFQLLLTLAEIERQAGANLAFLNGNMQPLNGVD